MGSKISGRFLRWAVSQFGRPTGFWGHVAGWIMANRRSNVERNLWTVGLLEVRPTDQVLEIGYGPGIAIRAISRALDADTVFPKTVPPNSVPPNTASTGTASNGTASNGTVTGVDHSAVMARQATRRNRLGVASGRVRLFTDAFSDLPEDSGPFDKVSAVNVVMFWDDPVAQLRALRERMTPSGRIALALQPRSLKATDGDARRAGEPMAGQLRAAGFGNLRLEWKPMLPVAAVCVLGER